MATASIRVLLVEDSKPFRQFFLSTLQNSPELQVVGGVSDGFEAVQKAQELQPDLILLDIGLPTLNGIEAARRIRKLSPRSIILFVSQESSPDIVGQAFSVGAAGYVVKTDAGTELLTAVKAVLRGEKFVGSRFSGHDFTGTPDAAASQCVRGVSVFAPRQQNMHDARNHEAGFYSDDRRLLEDLTQFIGAALKAGNAAIVVATESHRESLLPRLQACGLDMGAALEQGRYIELDAADALTRFMVNGLPDPVRFMKLLGSLIVTTAEAAKKEQARVAVFGEMCHLLWERGNAQTAIQIEQLGNHIAKTYDVDILCGYSVGCVHGGMESHIFHRLCAEHSAIYSG